MAIRRMWIIGLVTVMMLTVGAGSGYVAAQDLEQNLDGGFTLAPACGEWWTCSSGTAGLTVDNRTGAGDGIRGYANSSLSNRAGIFGVNISSGPGVYGRSDGGGPGVAGYSTSGYALLGKGAYGVWGESNSSNKAGVYGKNTQVNGWGVRGVTTKSGGIGVYGTGLGNGTGVYGTSTTGTGVMGISNDGDGMYGLTNDATDAGVRAVNGGTGPAVNALSGGIGVNALSTTNDGVVGTTYAQNKSGVYGLSTMGTGYGVSGYSDNYFGMLAQGPDNGDGNSGDILLGGTLGEITTLSREWIGYSYQNFEFHLDENNDDADACFAIWNGTNNVKWQVCESSAYAATMISAGPEATVVNTASEGQRLMYDVAGTGIWLEDVGTATLLDGELVVPFDAAYTQMANLSQAYQVFVTATCDQPVLLYVSEKTATSFTVKGANLDGSPSGCAFDYRVVASRVGYETVRLEQYTEFGKDGE